MRPKTRLVRFATHWLPLLILGVLCSISAIAVLHVTNWRVTTVATPSMSPEIPVGALVVTAPVRGRLPIGSIIVFRPDGDAHTYVHRVIGWGPNMTYHTKGNNDLLPDPWSVTKSEIVGKELMVLPDTGWLVRAAPIFSFALIAAALVGYAFPKRRRWAMVDALALGFWFASYRLHPLVQWQIISVTHDARHVRAWLFNTGVFAVKIRSSQGKSVGVLPGHSATIIAPIGHAVSLVGIPDLTTPQWGVAGLVCLLPTFAAVLLISRYLRANPRPQLDNIALLNN